MFTIFFTYNGKICLEHPISYQQLEQPCWGVFMTRFFDNEIHEHFLGGDLYHPDAVDLATRCHKAFPGSFVIVHPCPNGWIWATVYMNVHESSPAA